VTSVPLSTKIPPPPGSLIRNTYASKFQRVRFSSAAFFG